VLGPFILEFHCLSVVPIGLVLLLVADRFLLRLAEVKIFLFQQLLLFLSLLLEAHFFMHVFIVALPDIYYLVCLVLGLLNFFPGLHSS